MSPLLEMPPSTRLSLKRSNSIESHNWDESHNTERFLTRHDCNLKWHASYFVDAESQHQRRGAGVYGDGQDEPDGRGMDVPHERRPSVLQGEGRDAIAARSASAPYRVKGEIQQASEGMSIKGITQNSESEAGEIPGVTRMEFVDAPVLEGFRKAYVVYAPPCEVL